MRVVETVGHKMVFYIPSFAVRQFNITIFLIALQCELI